MMDRRSRILAGLDLEGAGLEIGAGYNPVTVTSELRVEYLDHADQASLIRKYAEQGIDTSRIPPIDYVWRGESYGSLVGDKRYDWIIASHVIEHVPDPIAFLNDCTAILTDNGVLSLAVPDKRRCFDFYRPPSSLARLVDAFSHCDRTATAGAVAEHIMYASTVAGAITWETVPEGIRPEFLHTAEQAREAYASVAEDAATHDVHVWTFTPASFRLIADDLFRLGIVPLRERSWHDTCGYEFFIQLSRQGSGPNVDRASLAREALSLEIPEPTPQEPASSSSLTATAHFDAVSLATLAAASPRGEILVRGTSGHPQIYLIRSGNRHAITTPEWLTLNGHSGAPVVVVDDQVIRGLAEGDTLSA